MDAKQLFESLKILQVVNTIPKQVFGVCCNTDDVVDGGIFVCIKGGKFDGHDFVKKAVEKGASVIVCQKQLDIDVCQIVVEDTHKAMSVLASSWYGYPSKNSIISTFPWRLQIL